MKGIVLIGLRRAGKSTAGRSLAAALGRPFLDTDELVLERTGRTAGRWIAESGIETFRAIERSIVLAAVATPGAVVAAGGGAPLDPRSRDLFAAYGDVLYLRADPFVLQERAARDPAADARPVLGDGAADDECFRLFAERDAAYFALCRGAVEAGGSPEETLAAILARLANFKN